MADGYWIGRGVPSVVDWCEPNYVVTPYVAEFWNSVSSFAIAAWGVYGLVRWLREGRLSRRWAICFAGLVLVGLGSVAFHATLLRIPQALDELPMIYLGLAAAWAVSHRSSPPGGGRGWAIGLTVYALLFTAGYAWLDTAYFAMFLASYAGLVAYVGLRSVYLTWWIDTPLPLRLPLLGAGVGFLGAFCFFWAPEHLYLSCDHPAQALHLHSLWHLGAGAGTYLWILWGIGDRARALGGTATWKGGFLVPDAA